MLDLELPDDDWDSVGGFVFGTLGHVPEVGESVLHEGWRFAVVELDGRRIRSVRITYIPESDPSRTEPAQTDEADGDRRDRRDEHTADQAG